MSDTFWTSRFNAESKMYTCAWCPRELKSKMSNSAKNPGRGFVSCAKDFGGCGLFCFLDSKPDDKFRQQQGEKRARAEPSGTNIVGPVAAAMGDTDKRVAELATENAALRAQMSAILSKLDVIFDYVKQVNE